MKVKISRIFYYLFPHIKKHWVAFILMLLGYSLGALLDNIFKPLIIKSIIDTISSGADKALVFSQSVNFLIVMGIVILVQNVGYRAGDYFIAYFTSKVMKELYDSTLKRLLLHSYSFFSNNFSGSLIAKSRRFVRQFETLIDIVSFQILFSGIILSGILIVLFLKVPMLACVFLGWAVLYILMTFLFIRKKIYFDTDEAKADSLVTGRFSDTISNVFNIKIFSTDKKEIEYFSSVTEEEEFKRRKSWNFGNFQNLCQGLMMGSLQIFVLFLNMRFWYLGKITLGTFVLVQSYMFNLFDILWNLGRSLTRAMKAMTDMQEVVDIFDTPIDITDRQNPEKPSISNGHIIFNNVSFTYKNGISILKDFSLEIKPGERVGLVGRSGAGKTTITRLLLRFSDVSRGEILIDGQNIKNITQNDLRSAISYVPQEPILFHRSIRENISYGTQEATEEEIESVAKKAHAHEFVSNLPSGYDTLVGERGIKLSGGERQRIAIARAMLKKAPILVLDEATSSLDSVSERYIQESFDDLMKGKTSIVIAHRLSTVQKMDRILVLENGEIVEEGNHFELLKRGGVYAKLWNHQTGEFFD